jgi:hypothetical protein
MLNTQGIESDVVHVVDNNGIDRVVSQYNPSHVFIEALWVVPSKFTVLTQLHPNVTWVIRIHSETPFLAGEGIAVEWILDYIQYPNVQVAFNSRSTYNEFMRIVPIQYQCNIIYLPNYYTGSAAVGEVDTDVDVLDVGCFGAIRPLKNQLIQAVAAVMFAKSLNRPLRFHMNSTRIEGKGEAILKNIQALFEKVPNAVLVEHSWLPHQKFVELISTMDINMQVSLSETFNIVTADAVVNNVPVVVSHEINWVSRLFRADPTSAWSIVFKLWVAFVLGALGIHQLNKWGLRRYNRRSLKTWISFIDF